MPKSMLYLCPLLWCRLPYPAVKNWPVNTAQLSSQVWHFLVSPRGAGSVSPPVPTRVGRPGLVPPAVLLRSMALPGLSPLPTHKLNSSLGKKKELGLVAFADCHGVNTPPVANFKLQWLTKLLSQYGQLPVPQ